MSRYFIPTNHDADPQGIILNRFFPFIEDLVERAIERADPEDGAEDIVTAFLDSHQEELDSTFDAFVSLYRILNILPNDPSDGTDDDSRSPSPTPGITHTTFNHATNSTPSTQVNGIVRRLGNGTVTTATPEDGPDDISHHGNGDNQVSTPSWVLQYHMREAQRRLNAAGMQTTATTALLLQNGVRNAAHVNGNGTHSLMAGGDSESSENNGVLLPPTTYTQPANPLWRGAQNMTGANGNDTHHVTEELSDGSSEGNDDSAASATDATFTRHVFQLPMVIGGGSSARHQTASGQNLPRFGNMFLGSVDDG